MFKIVIISLFLFVLPSYAQAAWPISGASTTYPRTLLTSSEISLVKNSILGDPSLLGIYADLYGEAISTLPSTANTSSSGRYSVSSRAKNIAFVHLLAMDNLGQTLSPADLATLKTNAISLLENANINVQDFVTYDFLGLPNAWPYLDWQWRSKESIALTAAYDLLRGSGVTALDLTAAETNITNFIDSQHLKATAAQPILVMAFALLSPGTNIGTGSFSDLIVNNHGTMTHNSIAYGGIVFDGHAKAESWLHHGAYYTEQVLFSSAGNSMSDRSISSGYAEGPSYLVYHSLNHLPVIQALKNYLPNNTYSWTTPGGTVSIPHPAYDSDIERLFAWMVNIALPDGRYPALEDGWHDSNFLPFAIYENEDFVVPITYSENLKGTTKTPFQNLNTTADLRADFLSAMTKTKATPNRPLFYSNADAGNLVFRSSNESNATYLHANGQNGKSLTAAAGHNQGDETSFMLVHEGKELLIDPGYMSWSQRSQVSGATDHNLILVNGAGPSDCLGWTGDLCLGVDGTEHSTVSELLDGEMFDVGNISSFYKNTNFDRSIISVDGADYFIVADMVKGSASHTYTHQLHGIESYVDVGGVSTWTHDTSKVSGLVISEGNAQAQATSTNQHEIEYTSDGSSLGTHTVLETSATSTDTSFLSVLVPHTSESFTLQKLSNASGVSAAIYESGQTKDLIIVRNGDITENQYTLTSSETGLHEVSSDADVLVLRYLGGVLSQIYMQDATNATVGEEYSIAHATEKAAFEAILHSPDSSAVKTSRKPSVRRVGTLKDGFSGVSKKFTSSKSMICEEHKEAQDILKIIFAIIHLMTGSAPKELLCQ